MSFIATEIIDLGSPMIESGDVLLALPWPANHDRIEPDEIPTDPDLFHKWAGTACVEWPPELMAESFRAWLAATTRAEPRDGGERILAFRMVYYRWWILPESEKEARMHRCQVEGSRREYNRREATRIARRGM